MELQELPHNIELENSILGICIYEGFETFAKAHAFITNHEIFYDSDNQNIWKTLCDMYDNGTPIEPRLVTNELRTNSQKSIGGNNWAYEVQKRIDLIVTNSYLTHWCIKIVEHYMKRESIKAVYSLASVDATEIMKEVDAKLKKATEFKNVNDWMDMSMVALQLINRREKIEQGIEFGVKTGFKEFDILTGGLESGFIVIAARPSMGKTAFAVSLAMSMAQLGNGVGIISLEMPAVQLAGRFASIVSGSEFWRVFRNVHQNESQKQSIDSALLTMSSLPIFITDNTKINLSDIRYKAEKLVKQKGAKCIMIDYLQLVDSESGKKNETREREVAKLSKGLKHLSTELGVPIIALAQLNRESESADKVSKVGKLSQLRESGSIEQDIDLGIIVDRPFKRGMQFDENGSPTDNQAFIHIEKFRNGETKIIEMEFVPTLMLFKEKGIHFDSPHKIHRDISAIPNIKPFNENPF